MINLQKARSHKYIKRTGGPGSYKYWYKLPNGKLVSSPDSPQQHKKNKTIPGPAQKTSKTITVKQPKKQITVKTSAEAPPKYKSVVPNTKLVKSVDFSNQTPKVQKQLNNGLNFVEIILNETGVILKRPIRFGTREQIEGQNIGAEYQPEKDHYINIVDFETINKSLMHEIGHAIDFSIGHTLKSYHESHTETVMRRGIKSEADKLLVQIIQEAKKSEYYQQPKKDISKLREKIKTGTSTDFTQLAEKKEFKEYLSEENEIFARVFEVYVFHAAQDLIKQGKIDKSALHNFSPDLMKQNFDNSPKFKEMTKQNDDLNNKILDAKIKKDTKKEQELITQQKEHINDMVKFKNTYESELKNDESVQKINNLMKQFLSLEPIKKSLKGKTPTFTGWKLQDKYKFQGMDISIENKKGSFRHWKNRNGESGKTKMQYDYGYIRNTLGNDGDHVDCVHPDTLVTLSDLSLKKAKDINVDDILLGFDENPSKDVRRKFKNTKVLRLKSGMTNSLEFKFNDGSSIITTLGHQHLSFKNKERKDTHWKRADKLEIGEELSYVYNPEILEESEDYKLGYLYGSYKGDGSVCFKRDNKYVDISVCIDDKIIVERIFNYLSSLNFDIAPPRQFKPSQTKSKIEENRVVLSSKDMFGLFIRRREQIKNLEPILTQIHLENKDWCRGVLAGLLDTDGSFNKNWEIFLSRIKDQQNTFKIWSEACKRLGFDTKIRGWSIFLKNNLKKDNQHLRFLSLINPALLRKKCLNNLSVGFLKKTITDIKPIISEYVAIQTDCRTYIANGLATHNCYIGPNEDAKYAYVIHQVVPNTGEFDEDKTMLGFNSEEEAKEAYLSHYSSPKFFGSMTTFPIDEFKEKVIGKKIKIIKSVGHKYIKRTGSPGNYKYWYRLPNGKIVNQRDPYHDLKHKVDEAEDNHVRNYKEITVEGKKKPFSYKTHSGEDIFIDKDKNEYVIDHNTGGKIIIDSPLKKLVIKEGGESSDYILSSGRTIGEYRDLLKDYGRDREIFGKDEGYIKEHEKNFIKEQEKRKQTHDEVLARLPQSTKDAFNIWTMGNHETKSKDYHKETDFLSIRNIQRGITPEYESPEEIEEINKYRRELGLGEINTEKDSSEIRESSIKALKTMEKGFKSFPRYDGSIFRGVDISVKKLDIEVGDIYTMDSFSSFSASKSAAQQFGSTVFVVKKNKSGRDISFIGSWGSEEEVLVPKGTKYRVRNIEEVGNKTYIHMDEEDGQE